MELAVEYGHVASNPARGRRRRLAAGKPRRVYLDRAAQIEALLSAAAELDGRALVGPPYRRALLVTAVFSGARIGELLDLRWADVRLPREDGNVVPLRPDHGRLRINGTKTDNARREVRLLGVLRHELEVLREARGPVSPTERVFRTSTGGRLSESNVRNRIVKPAVRRANEHLAEAEDQEIPAAVSPHALRRTFTSVLFALGEAPPTVMRESGHQTAGFTLEVYARGDGVLRGGAGAAPGARGRPLRARAGQ